MYTILTHEFINTNNNWVVAFKLNLHLYASRLQNINFKTSGGHTSKTSECGATAFIHLSLKYVWA